MRAQLSDEEERDAFQDVTCWGFLVSEVRLMIIELISLKQVTSHLLTASPGELF